MAAEGPAQQSGEQVVHGDHGQTAGLSRPHTAVGGKDAHREAMCTGAKMEHGTSTTDPHSSHPHTYECVPPTRPAQPCGSNTTQQQSGEAMWKKNTTFGLGVRGG